MSELVQLVSAVLAATPPGVNPYPVLRREFREALFPRQTNAVLWQLYVLAGLVGVCIVVLLAALVVRAYRRTFWVFRISSGQDRYLRPHGTLSWAIPALILCILLEAFIWRLYDSFSGIIHPDFLLWQTAVWLPAGPVAFQATWSLAVSYIFHLSASKKRPPTWLASAKFVNIAGPAGSVGFVGTIAPLAIMSNAPYRRFIGAVNDIESFLASAEVNWTGEQVGPLQLVGLMPIANTLAAELLEAAKWTSAAFFTYFGWGCLIFMSLLTISIMFFSSVKDTLNKPVDTKFYGASAFSAVSQATVISSRRRRVLLRAHKTLIATITCFSLIAVVFNSTALYVAIETMEVFHHPDKLAICINVILYPSLVFAIPCFSMVLLQSFDVMPTSLTSSDSRPLDGGGPKFSMASISFPPPRGAGIQPSHGRSISMASVYSDTHIKPQPQPIVYHGPFAAATASPSASPRRETWVPPTEVSYMDFSDPGTAAPLMPPARTRQPHASISFGDESEGSMVSWGKAK